MYKIRLLNNAVWFVGCNCLFGEVYFSVNQPRELNSLKPLFKQALIDGPCTNVCRKALNFKHLSLTDFKITVGPSAKSGPVKKAFEKGEILEKWEKTAWAKKLVTKKKRATLTDFDRFKLKLAKQKVGGLFLICWWQCYFYVMMYTVYMKYMYTVNHICGGLK